MKEFNVTGLCIPEKHYMVDISGKLATIREMVGKGDYFAINRARQYGKTTTLFLLEKMLQEEYFVVSISFEGLGEESFASSAAFCRAFMGKVHRALRFTKASDAYRESWLNRDVVDFDGLGDHITHMAGNKKIVLMIDEVDKTSNNKTFLNFLGLLRDKYLERAKSKDYTFHSVILAGVYDVRNIKQKLLNEGLSAPKTAETQIYNSPWNIAADFEVDLSFNPQEIATMLAEYEADHNTGMDVPQLASAIHNYTGGYPFLVSRVCQCLDRKLNKDWTIPGVQEAVRLILREKNTLFDDLIKNLENDQVLHNFLYDLLFVGKDYEFNIYNPLIGLGHTFGFLEKGACNKTVVSNKIFEILLYDYFILKETLHKRRITGVLQRDVVEGGRFDMELCLNKFAEHYAEIFSERDAGFIEREGRLLFLSYLKPLLNGQGFYRIESQFTDLRQMDIVVDFAQGQFIIELKLWKGEAEHQNAYTQLAGYLDRKGAKTGYLLTFDFRKGKRQPSAAWVDFSGKQIFDVIV